VNANKGIIYVPEQLQKNIQKKKNTLERHAPFIGEIFAKSFSIAMRTASFDIFLQMTGLKKYHKSLCIPPTEVINNDRLSGR
jgi:hypothetical protein